MTAFTFVLITTIGISQTPGLSEAECRWAVQSAPIAVAQWGPDIRLVSASCERERT